jgi:glycerophosphoryl diester phosphodiesterase
VTDSQGQRTTIPGGYSISSGGSLTVYSGPGSDSADAFYAGLGRAIWNNSGGDTATLRNAGGTIIDTYSYDS